ncbi:MAG: hypothetical protein JW843_06760 [Candidatus Aminicenantes bacterium]|nr:hypothetical protein [Candidatus Aminicenantes bacterium]
MNQEKRGDILHSWKEISAYLGCDIRTCQRWAKGSGLPVFKLGTEKGRVYAKREDIDRWIAAKSARNGNGSLRLETETEKAKAAPADAPARKRRSPLPIIAALGPAVVFIAFLGWTLRKSVRESDIPVDFHIEGSVLTIVNRKNQPLGEFDTKLENLKDEAEYRKHFQTKRSLVPKSPHLLKIMFKDIVGDSRLEVMFAAFTKNEMDGGTLFCLDSKGNKLWSLEMGRPMTTGTRTYPNDFVIRGIGVDDLNGDGRAEIVVASNILHFNPTQIAIVSPEGRLEAEYWNAGQISDFEFRDYDGDGRKEIFLTGLNNEYKKGCLIVLDPSEMNGASPQFDPTYKLNGIQPGNEEFYLLFPRSEIDSFLSDIPSISALESLNDGFYLHSDPAQIVYTLNLRMDVVAVAASNPYESLYNRLRAEGQIHAPFDRNRVEDALKKGILYWNGKEWVGHVARADGRPLDQRPEPH